MHGMAFTGSRFGIGVLYDTRQTEREKKRQNESLERSCFALREIEIRNVYGDIGLVCESCTLAHVFGYGFVILETV
jgi:hypothetical protein